MSLPQGTPLRGVTIVGAKDVAPYNLRRRALTFQNKSDTQMVLAETNEDASATVGYAIPPGEIMKVSTNMRISVYCTVAGKAYEVTET